MRLYILIGLCILLTTSVSAASTTSALPVINTTANEYAILNNETIKLGPVPLASTVETPQGVTYTLNTGSARSFFVKPLRWLESGAYDFFVTVSDLVGNRKDSLWQFTVNNTGQRITLVDPEFGGTNDIYADVRIQTELPSVCRWWPERMNENDLRNNATFNRMYKFNATYDNPREFHDIIDFFFTTNSSKKSNTQVVLSISCDDGTRKTPKEFVITYINASTPPKFSVTNNPDPIIDVNDPQTTLTVTADQEVWCTGDGRTIFGNRTYYNFRNPQTGTYEDPLLEEKPFVNITCYNRALNSTSQLYALRYNYTSPLVITVQSPAAVQDKAYKLNFTTNKVARCSVLQDGAAVPVSFPDAGSTRFLTDALSLREGNTTFTISCAAYRSDPATKTFSVIVDTANPVLNNVFISPVSCGQNSITAVFNATDGVNGSGVDHYNYSVKTTTGQNVTATKTTTNKEVTIPVRFNASQQYVVVAKAIDRAGRASTEVTSAPMKVTDATDIACDKEDPYTTLIRTSNLTVAITCQDKVACTNAFLFETVNASSKCTLGATNIDTRFERQYEQSNNTKNRISSDLAIDLGDTVCWSVADTAGHRVFDFKTFKQLPPPPTPKPTPKDNNTCTNGVKDGLESDVDCGGAVCAAQGKLCPEKKTCYSALDCTSGNCASNVCAQATCTDGFRNGDETGRDCGGSCGACTAGEQCTTNFDCAAGQSCDRGVCSSYTQRQEETTPPDEGEQPLATESNFLSFLLIILGTASILGGSAYIVLYEPRKEDKRPVHEPIATFERAVDTSEPKQQHKKAAKRKKLFGKERVENLIGEFDAEELKTKDEVTHKDIEEAYKQLDKEEFTALTKDLLKDNKVQHKDVEIALADAEDDDKVIEDLRQEFGLKKKK